jgi:hypothetical protein
MKTHQALIQSHTLEPLGSPAVWVTWLNQAPKPRPGQVFLIEASQTHELAQVCLPLQIREDALLFEPPAGNTWSPGERLVLWGPLGIPFDPPSDCHKWLLLAPEGHLGRLLPLLEHGLEQGISLAVWASHPISNLPPAVELLPSASEGMDWADYIAIDLGEVDRVRIETLPPGSLKRAKAAKIEVLLTPPMPCGFGGCGVCAVKGKRGWLLACLDGPVFDWKSLGS